MRRGQQSLNCKSNSYLLDELLLPGPPVSALNDRANSQVNGFGFWILPQWDPLQVLLATCAIKASG
jgi:hypothetical protein